MSTQPYPPDESASPLPPPPSASAFGTEPIPVPIESATTTTTTTTELPPTGESIPDQHPLLPSSTEASTGSEAEIQNAQPESQLTPAPIKPFLNPLQTDGPPPSSTTVEPPRSPNALNNSTNAEGLNAGINGNGDYKDTPTLSPLPKDATVPPTPDVKDETPPLLPPGAIPPAVSTPTVFETEIPVPGVEISAPVPENQVESALAKDNLAAPVPQTLVTPVSETVVAPSAEELVAPGTGFSASPAVVAPVVSALESVPTVPQTLPDSENAIVNAAASYEPMEIDSSGIGESSSSGSLKRPGDELEGREEKRPKEEVNGEMAVDAPAISNGLPSVQPNDIPSEAAPTGTPASAPAFVLPQYTPGPPRPSGPETPLTITQHRHILGAVRQLKKNKWAIPFLQPVDAIALGLPHYPQVITKPMDLSTVETKLIASDPKLKDGAKVDLSKGKYNNVSEAVMDVRQIWENTRIFNGPAHPVSANADILDESFEKSLSKLPQEPAPAPVPPPKAPSPVAPSPAARRPSVSQAPPTIRRSSTGPDATRPKREIHPPPSKDLAYDVPGSGRKLKRRNDNQLKWAHRIITSFGTVKQYMDVSSPFFYPVEELVQLVSGYAEIIKRPIDLNIIKTKIDEGEYEDVTQVDADMKLMVANALKFNPPDHEVHTAALQMRQIWEEKYKTCPPKQEARGESEDAVEMVEDESDGELSGEIASLETKIAEDQTRLAELKSRHAKRKANRPTQQQQQQQQQPRKSKPKTSGSKQQQRKQSMGNGSPNGHGQGHNKKSASVSKKREEESEDEDEGTVTLTQKQELAEKIQLADGDVLTKAIAIIQQTTNLGANNEEIELDIDSLPPRTVMKLYNLVCRPNRNKPRAPPRNPSNQQTKKPRKAVNRKSMNEIEEAERIKRMEAQLQSFEGGGGGGGGGRQAYDEEGSESSEEESSDEE